MKYTTQEDCGSCCYPESSLLNRNPKSLNRLASIKVAQLILPVVKNPDTPLYIKQYVRATNGWYNLTFKKSVQLYTFERGILKKIFYQ